MEASALPSRGRIHVPIGKALLGALGDERLVEQVRGGNERAFEVVYDRYHASLLAFCRHMLGSSDEAEDALQQVFVSAHADLQRSRRPIILKPWLYAIARNRCVSMLRVRREESTLVEPVTDGLADQVERRMELRDLVADLHQLPEDQRAALVLAEIGALSHAEIGQVIGSEVPRVKSLIFQARSKLIEARKARETPCAEIREQLATLHGGALRRGELKRHVRVCPGCAEFREEVRRQRAMMAVLLPVLPSVGLKRSVLAAAGIGSAGAGAGAGAGGAGIVAGLAAKGGVAKLVVGCAVGAAAVGGGIAVEKEVRGSAGTASTNAAPVHASPRAHERAAPQSAVTGAPTPRSPASSRSHRAHHAPPAAAHRGHHLVAKGHAKQQASTRTVNPVAESRRQAKALGHSEARTRTAPAHAPKTRKVATTPRRPRPIPIEQPPPEVSKTPPGRPLGAGN